MDINRIIIYPFIVGSEGAVHLRDELRARGHNCIQVYPDKAYKIRDGDYIINWGTHRQPSWCNRFVRGRAWDVTQFRTQSARFVNDLGAVGIAKHKILTFDTLSMTACRNHLPDYWVYPFQHDTVEQITYPAVARTLINSMDGKGCYLVKNEAELKDIHANTAPVKLVTKYQDGPEFRVDIFKGELISYMEKKRKNGWASNPNFNPFIRTEDNGWVWCTTGVTPLDPVVIFAKQVASLLQLDFASIDIRLDMSSGRPVLLEPNTAPGITAHLAKRYADAIERDIKNISYE